MAARGKVLILGDSISIGYAPVAARELAGDVFVAHHEGNSGDSANLLAHLDAWLAADADADLVHFNVGLHDLRLWRRSGEHQVPLVAYRDNLAEIVRRLEATGKALVWATTTPVDDERNARGTGDFFRRNADVLAYNAAAREIVDAAGIPVNDLYAVIADAGPGDCLREDGVHMTDRGYVLLGQTVAAAVSRHGPA